MVPKGYGITIKVAGQVVSYVAAKGGSSELTSSTGSLKESVGTRHGVRM